MNQDISIFKKNFLKVSQPFFFLDKQLQIFFVNNLCKELFKEASIEHTDRFLGNIFVGDKRFQDFCKNKELIEEGIYFTDCQFKELNTKYFLYLNPMYDLEDNFIFYLCSFQFAIDKDIKSKEKNLYYEIFDKLNTGIIHAANATIIDVNEAFTRLTGLKKTDIIGNFSISMVKKFCSLKNLQAVQKIMRKYILGQKIDKEVIFFNNKYLQISTSGNQETVLVQDISEETKTLKKLEEMHSVANKLSIDLSKKEYYDIVIDASKQILDFSFATIIIVNGDHLVLQRSTVPSYKEGIKLNLKQGIYGKTLHKQKSYLINDISKNNEIDLFTLDYNSTLSVPIGKYGIFQAHSIEKNAFQKNDLKMAELLVSHLEQALLRLETQTILAKKEKKYKAVFENAAISTVLLDKDGNINLVNDKFADKFGFNENKESSIFNYFQEDQKTILKKHIDEIIKIKRDKTIIFESEVFCKDIYCNVICYLKSIPDDNQLLISFVDITKLKLYEKKLNNSIYEKDILLKEIHHRVKNNLQLISSFIRIYLNSLDQLDKEVIFKEINSKINSIGIVHERLYKSDSYNDISIKKYIEKLLPELLSTYKERQIIVKYDLEDIYIDLNKSIPLGLILSEVITNSIKYAFPKEFEKKPIIGIKLRKSNKFYEFTVYDNGVGIKKSEKSFGHELITILTKQLGGYMNLTNNQGVTFDLRIPIKE